MNPCPHAPYAEGPADFAIGLRAIAEADWLEGGEPRAAIRGRKLALLQSAPAAVWGETSGSRPAQAEAAAMVARAAGLTAEGVEPPLLCAALSVPDDLCLMEKRGDQWTLTALSLSAGTFFTADEVVGRTLVQLHEPVPGFGKLLPRVARIFDALRPDLILQRRNWTVIGSDALHLPDPEPVRAALSSVSPQDAGARLFLRIERQTVRRLPRTGAVLFTIRVWTESLSEMASRPERLVAFQHAWRNAAPEFRAYKRLDGLHELVAAFLEGPELRPAGESPAL